MKLREPVRHLRRRLARRMFEQGDLEDTYGRIELAEFGLEHPEHLHYEPSGWNFLRRALRGREITRRDVLIDYGCGKGRVVYQAAASYPFGRVLGIEISPQLARVAQRNIARNRSRLVASEVEIVCADASTYELPDDTTYAYLYNPFAGETFSAAIGQIVASLDRRPRPLTLIYSNPQMAHLVAATGRFESPQVIAASHRGRLGPLTLGSDDDRTRRTINVYVARSPSPVL